ncbi:MAG: integration host factor subunit beta [Candidatus Omnitrophica bacterium]|nr:integration host factor subunit beta [Candidatus Omnitrophota bacterium]
MSNICYLCNSVAKIKIICFFDYVNILIEVYFLFLANYFINHKNNKIMTKADIIYQIVEETGLYAKDVRMMVEYFMKTVKNNMVKGRNVYLRGFGSFILKKRAEKKARVISRNETIIIPEHYIPSFKPAKSFMDKVKNNVNK